MRLILITILYIANLQSFGAASLAEATAMHVIRRTIPRTQVIVLLHVWALPKMDPMASLHTQRFSTRRTYIKHTLWVSAPWEKELKRFQTSMSAVTSTAPELASIGHQLESTLDIIQIHINNNTHNAEACKVAADKFIALQQEWKEASKALLLDKKHKAVLTYYDALIEACYKKGVVEMLLNTSSPTTEIKKVSLPQTYAYKPTEDELILLEEDSGNWSIPLGPPYIN